jgi:hypothetical protein
MSAALLALAGCGGGSSDTQTGVSSTKVDTVKVAAGVVVNAVQANLGTLAATPGTATDAWSTPAGQLIGVTLLAQYDSSGADAWDASKHPLVYMTSEGGGYSGTIAATDHPTSEIGLPTQVANGLAIIDANSYEPVATAAYKATGVTTYGEPHGLGVSADGKWIYVQGTHPSSDLSGNGVLLIINARTLKVDKMIRSRVHHARNIYSATLKKNLVLIDGWGTFFALDPSDDNKVVGSVNPANLVGSGYLAFGDPSGQYLFIATRTGWGDSGGVAVISMADWLLKTRVTTFDSSPIWVSFTSDGKTAYVSGGHESMVSKIDMSDLANPANWSMTGITQAGTAGPYGITNNWKDNMVFAVGKGEGTHNLGNTLGVVSTTATAYRSLGELAYGCVRGDHAIVHPDPAKNELWVSCNSSFNNVVVDMGDGTTFNSVKVKKVIANPNGGSSHNGSFVKYTVSGSTWAGELLSDTNGMQGSAIQTKKDVIAGKTPVGGK